MNLPKVNQKDVLAYRKTLEKIADCGHYFLNPDKAFTFNLVRSLIINRKRYGYEACPCRLAVNDRKKDINIICPCYYRDNDVSEYGNCFCGLYVSQKKYQDKSPITTIPERRNMKKIKKLPIWRCQVCGYLCARATAPDVCPICGVNKERFEIFEK